MKDNSIWIHSPPCCNIIVHSRSNLQIVLHTFQPLQLIPHLSMEKLRDTQNCCHHLFPCSRFGDSVYSLCSDIGARSDRARGGRSLQVCPVGGQDPDVWQQNRPQGTEMAKNMKTFSGNVYSRIHFHEYLNRVLEILLSFFGLPKIFCWFTSSALSLI